MSNMRASVDALARLSIKRPLRAIFLSVQHRQFCDAEPRSANLSGIHFDILTNPLDVLRKNKKYDVLILACHNQGEEALLFDFHKTDIAQFYFSWLWDHHHHPIENLRTSLVSDVLFVAHWKHRQYLNHPCVLPGDHIPSCTRQWSAELIEKRYANGLPTDRSDAIYGGYGNYGWATQRNEFIQQFARQCTKHSLDLVDLTTYWQQPASTRLQHWMSHKVHLVVPVANDLSTRVFEALVTGQIPLVPDDIPDLDRIVSSDLQASLPILRYRAFSVESAHKAYRAALNRFAADGPAGVQRRFEFVRDHHSLRARLAAFADFIRRPRQYDIGGDGRVCQWNNWKGNPAVTTNPIPM